MAKHVLRTKDDKKVVIDVEKDIRLYQAPVNPPNTGQKYTSGTDLYAHKAQSGAMSEIDWYGLATDKIKDFRGRIKEGETSAGSLRMTDIVEGVADLLTDDLADEWNLYDEDDPDDTDAMTGIFEEIMDHLQEITPDGLTFGASEGDGASYGFWKIEEEEA